MSSCYILRVPDIIQEILDRLDGSSAVSFISTCQLMHNRWRSSGLLRMCLQRMNYHKDAIAFLSKEEPFDVIQMLNFSAFLETSCQSSRCSPFKYKGAHMEFKRGLKGISGTFEVPWMGAANYEIVKIEHSSSGRRYIHFKLSNLGNLDSSWYSALRDSGFSEHMVMYGDASKGGLIKETIVFETFAKYRSSIEKGFSLQDDASLD
mmetsp:Transcript_17310/g.19289  ORF Transcript_17310/g.19289 Transcript_17310/m.19289 type:complete len:206 (+) Transcript_17310:111-728(+)